MSRVGSAFMILIGLGCFALVPWVGKNVGGFLPTAGLCALAAGLLAMGTIGLGKVLHKEARRPMARKRKAGIWIAAFGILLAGLGWYVAMTQRNPSPQDGFFPYGLVIMAPILTGLLFLIIGASAAMRVACPSCDAPVKGSYCGKCGSSIHRNCPSCGIALEDRFCPSCGTAGVA